MNELNREDLAKLLIASVNDINAGYAEIRLDGMTDGGKEIGDWVVTVQQCATPEQPAQPEQVSGEDGLVGRLQRMVRDLGEHRLTHVTWRDWLRKDPANEKVNPHAGSAQFHDDTIKDYDRHLANIEEAIRRLAAEQNPEAT